ncbi:MAG: sulfatase-like hydrolase/transferase [Armatimonadetes bacterium]|nr:sulfatase-like hydrolase/transferase [Armatimonadota bacterium]
MRRLTPSSPLQAGLMAGLLTLVPAVNAPAYGEAAAPPRRPNILWISAEDLSPDLGSYGDTYARTPNLDRLAKQGVRYANAFSSAPVCAPSRSAIITGMYAPAIGTQHMRSKGVPPPEVRCFTEYLRAAGYFCTNRSKTDYNFDSPATAWDQLGQKAHWRNRPAGKPFFSVINLETSHEGKVRAAPDAFARFTQDLKPEDRHDPAKAKLPPYYPDTSKVRNDWARYHDLVTAMDLQAGEILKQLEEDGLAENTIVVFWGDHGRGLSRGKRWVYDSGIQVPLIVRWPGTLKPGSVRDDLVSLMDLGPTMLSIAGVKVPAHMQGRAFLGNQKPKPREYVYAHRDRMDETLDIIRGVRDKRYKYIRNYRPDLPYAQNIAYMDEMPMMSEWRRLQVEGGLVGPQKLFFRHTKPVEELYDTLNDPHEIHNLAGDPKHRATLERLRNAHVAWMKESGDTGLIPEPELTQRMRPRDRWQKAADPIFLGITAGESPKVRITCPTPGASIAYRFGEGEGGWQLYTRPVALEPGKTLRAKACRLGFEDSEVIEYPGEKLPPLKAKTAASNNWKAQLRQTDLLERLLAIKALDGQGAKAIPAYAKALNDPDPSVRYWAAWGIHAANPSPAVRTKMKPLLANRLKDPASVVRIAAAHALYDWGEEQPARSVLLRALEEGSDSARHYAIVALMRLGEKARPALPEIRAATSDSHEYVRRVALPLHQRWDGAGR